MLTVTDDQGLSHSVSRRLEPRTVNLTFTSNPAGLQIAVGSSAQATPFTKTVIEGSNNQISGVTPQMYAGNQYVFVKWSDGGPQTKMIVAGSTTAYSATFARPCVAARQHRPAAESDRVCAEPVEGGRRSGHHRDVTLGRTQPQLGRRAPACEPLAVRTRNHPVLSTVDDQHRHADVGRVEPPRRHVGQIVVHARAGTVGVADRTTSPNQDQSPFSAAQSAVVNSGSYSSAVASYRSLAARPPAAAVRAPMPEAFMPAK